MLEREQREQRDAEHGDRDQNFEQGEAGPPGARDSSRGRNAGEDFWLAAHRVAVSAVTGGTSPFTIPTLPVRGLILNVSTWPETVIIWITVAST